MTDSEKVVYFAHSANDEGRWNPLSRHLTDVAERARQFADAFNAGDSAYLAGLLHDLGKYGDLFQNRLKGKESGLDHWSIGASVCLEKFKNSEIAMAIQGHHLGLQWWDRDELRKLSKLEIPGNRRLTEQDPRVLLDRFTSDRLTLPDVFTRPQSDAKSTGAMFDLRMLFSALTDADYLATEEHFEQETSRLRGPTPDLRPAKAAAVLDRHLDDLVAQSRSSPSVAAIRQDLLAACRASSGLAPGLFTLTAPTGAGKTLSTLAFALRHAEHFGLRRIIVVMPFLSIIDQTARVYREALGPMANDDAMGRYLLEHHSLSIETIPGSTELQRLRGMLTQNWDAPIIITTSVQLLESLFSNSPATCRKLHRLAQSVVILDEVQTLPLKVVLPTLAALSHLSARYGASVVFSTATQPAFRHLDAQVRQYCTAGWRPKEIVPSELKLFERARRVRAHWPPRGERISWEELAQEFSGLKQALCIVNLKRHARELFRLLRPNWGDDVFHLSTAMCPKHRSKVLDEVRTRLELGQRCALVATQCVEAGVDLDFPTVFRAMAPLDSIAQAAGRCNRSGKLESGDLRVFVPEDAGSPPGTYKQGTDITAGLTNRQEEIRIDDPLAFDTYFRTLYSIAAMDNRSLREAIQTRNFPEVHQYFRIIDQDSVNVVVAYDRARYQELAMEARSKRLTREWIVLARPHAVNCFRQDIAGAMAEAVLSKTGEPSGDWYLYLVDDHYCSTTGLHIPKTMEFLGI